MLFRPARASDLDAICALLATSKRGPAYFHDLFAADPAFDPHHIRLAWTGGHIVACARIYPRKIRIGTAVVPACGIGNLRTDPRFWQKGLATALLAECVSAMYLDGAVLAPLFAPRQTLFQRRGWHSMPETILEIAAADIGEEAADAHLAGPVRVRAFEGRDLDDVMALHEGANAGRSGAPLRDRDDWLRCLTTLDLQGARLLVALDADGVAGYVAAQAHPEHVEILELLPAPWAESVWRPLLQAVLSMPDTPAVARAVLPADYRERICQDLGGRARVLERLDLMLRAVDLPALLNHIVPVLSARLRDRPATQQLRLRIGPLRGGAALAIQGVMLAVQRPRTDDTEILPEGAFLQLLLGTETAHAQLEALPLSAEARAVLAQIFPRQDWVFWPADAF